MAFPTKEDFIALRERITPDVVEADGPDPEVFEVQSEVFAYLSEKLENLLGQGYVSEASGPDFAEGQVEFYWNNLLDCALTFPAGALTIWGRRHGGRNLVPWRNIDPFTLDPSSGLIVNPGPSQTVFATAPATLDVKAARPGADQDVLAGRLNVLFRNGEHVGRDSIIPSATMLGFGIVFHGETNFESRDEYRVLRITSCSDPSYVGEMRQITSVQVTGALLNGDFGNALTLSNVAWEILELDQLGLSLRNTEDCEGGNFFSLDLLGRNRGLRRHKGETDAQFKNRLTNLADTVTGPAIQRALTRTMNVHAPGLRAVYLDAFDGPEHTAFGSETGDGEDDLIGIIDDPRADPAYAVSRTRMRNYFVVLVPTFYGWTPTAAAAVRRALHDAVERVKAGGAGWDMIEDASLG